MYYTFLGGFCSFIVSYVVLKFAGADFSESHGIIRSPGMGSIGVFLCTAAGACVGVGYDLAHIA